ISGIQNKLSDKDIYIEYFLADKDMYIFSISKEKSHISKKEIPNSFNSDINQFISSIKNKDENITKSTSKKLYTYLCKSEIELFKNKEKIIINPSEILGKIPFDILIQDNGKYLIEDYIISYQHSANHFIKENKIEKKEIRFCGIAPTYNGKNYKKLPFAKKEIKAIHEIFQGEIFMEKEATRKNFISSLYSNSILHLSGHTELNPNKSLDSKLIFSGEDSTRYLYAHELYNHRIKTPMVTLSACNSGVGEIKKSEGVLSISRAFAYAGCPSTTTTLWAVSDKPSSDIMASYYENLKKGQKKTIALRNAKLDYLKNAPPIMASPLYWAGFIHIGDDSPIVTDTSMTWFSILGIIFVILLLITIGFIVKKKNQSA
ncbi:MAG: CHAT domain-containing protein, partial [Saprospiraceae bacterium]